MRNDRGVYWELIITDSDGFSTYSEHDNAEAARKAARLAPAASQVKIYKVDPVHGPVEIMP